MRLVTIPLIILLAALYGYIYYSVFTQILIPEAIAVTLEPAMRRVNMGLLLSAPAILFLIIRATLRYSNRIVGPIPRLEREIDRVIAGDYSVRIKARNDDELKGFVSKVNSLIETVDKSRP
jgi:methyl-accepting chemotaxis protein